MASTDKPASEPEKVAPPPGAPAPETEKAAPPPVARPPESKAPADVRRTDYVVVADVILRVLLFASTLTSVVVMVTSKQTKLVQVQRFPFPVPVEAKFNHSPAMIYLVAALSVACLYSIISAAVSILALLSPARSKGLAAHFVIIDVLLLGIVSAATGAAGAVGYIGLKGNSHANWTKVCNVYDKFCRHVGSSVGISLFASVVLAFLVLLSIYTLSRKIRK